MRLEDKELEGPELEREQRLEVLEEGEETEHELPALALAQVEDVELAHRSRLFDALQLILAGEELDISHLYLPQRETHALEFLQAAVTGRDTMGMFVFAEDRASLLEQSLAVLQQNLTHGSSSALAELHAKFHALTGDVAGLRAHLVNLEDAQDELMEGSHRDHEIDAAGDTAEEAPDESVTGFIASALQALAVVAGTDVNTLRSTLDGPELPERAAQPSTLDGPERVALKKPATALGGPPLPDRTDAPTTLGAPGGPDALARPSLPSTLDGPERPEAEKRSSLLTEGMSKLIVPEHQRKSSPTIEAPVRKSSPTIEPRSRFPSVAPPTRTGRATTPPSGTQIEHAPSKLGEPAAPVRRGLSVRTEQPPLKPDVVITSDDPAPEPPKPAPPRGLSVRTTDKKDLKK